MFDFIEMFYTECANTLISTATVQFSLSASLTTCGEKASRLRIVVSRIYLPRKVEGALAQGCCGWLECSSEVELSADRVGRFRPRGSRAVFPNERQCTGSD